ncbi:MAG: hypothetical protein IPN71_21780 [Fibrobacteres bacterium]|nr:hypothetical protein [Fibrobacterota bacterium]
MNFWLVENIYDRILLLFGQFLTWISQPAVTTILQLLSPTLQTARVHPISAHADSKVLPKVTASWTPVWIC